MKIVVTGGGSGGHITPLLAVSLEIKRIDPKAKIIYIGQEGDKFASIPGVHDSIDESYGIRAGKFRRYHGEGWKQLLDVLTILKNIRDFFYVLIGLAQSYALLKKINPDVVFIKGGFVGVPIGLAAAKLHIPYITHDSDSVPGLANKIVARWAKLHAVAMAKEIYPYPQARTVTTGIPVQTNFGPVNNNLKAKYRENKKIPKSAKMLFIIGGGLGSQAINSAVIEVIPHLLDEFKDLWVVHGVGHANEHQMQQLYSDRLNERQQERVEAISFISDLYAYSGAADLIITRAGATNLAEFAAQGRACIVIPSPYLASGHQTKNADYLEKQGAIVSLGEQQLLEDPNRLAQLTSKLLKDDRAREELGKKIAKFAKPNAARELAELIVGIADR